MAKAIQDNDPVKVFTALPENTLLFSSLSGSERLSTLYDYQLTLCSENSELDLNDLLGTDISVELELARGGHRYFHGFVSKCSQSGIRNNFALYEFNIRPWFWFLTRTADCKIFQDLSVRQIIKNVFDDAGFTDYEDKLNEEYKPLNFCVQYRETDFNFLSRLMEQEGIYYYFKHEKGAHKLVLCDSIAAHKASENYKEVMLYDLGANDMTIEDHLKSWNLSNQLQPGKYAMRDFNFESPSADLLVQRNDPGKHARAEYEIYDYPGEYPDLSAGETAVRIRREESQAQQQIARGSGNAQGLAAGNLFTLTESEREDHNREYLITHSYCSVRMNNHVGNSNEVLDVYSDVSAIDSKQVFRAPRVTPKPLVQGAQTAIVVGPKGEEIWTDEYGRVKLHFHWDRYDDSNEESSCWVRVSQIWAGQGWGAMHIPRIGHEVIVEFLEGDPDRPIITGRVYNGENGVPYDLPANATQSGIKSRSSKGGSAKNFNEIRMEDKKGSEELYIQAEKNEKIKVKNNKSESVGANETINIGHNRKETVGNDETLHVKNDRNRTVDKNESVEVNGFRKHYVKLNEMINVAVAQEISVGAFQAINVGAFQAIDVGGYQMFNVGGYQDVNIAGYQNTHVGQDYTLAVKKCRKTEITEIDTLNIGADRQTTIKDGDVLDVGKDLKITAGDSIELATGSSKLSMKSDGKIELTGMQIAIKTAAATVEIDQAGFITIKGPMVKIN